MPTVTYVTRERLMYERSLRAAVAKGHTIVAITGPSKCGKTVLRKHVVRDDECIRVEGGQVASESDFWHAIRAQLDIPSTSSATASKQAGAVSEVGGGLRVPFASIGAKHQENKASTLSETRQFDGGEKSGILNKMLQSGKSLVVDDFHYIPSDVRGSVVRELKAPVFDGLSVIMLSVPYRAFDVISAENEMEGRFTHIAVEKWEQADLEKIAFLGFPAMGAVIDERTIQTLASEALGSPLLMQSLCAEICASHELFSTVDPPIKIDITDAQLRDVYEATARDYGLPAFEKLSRGPQTRSDRIPRRFVNGSSGDIYEAVIAAIAWSGADEQIAYDDLRTSLRSVLLDAVPQKHEVTRSIQHMCEIARQMLRSHIAQRENVEVSDEGVGNEVQAIDWKDDVIYLNDVFLRFYLRWIHKGRVGPAA